MNIGLIIGKKTSTGVPGKNLRQIVGRPTAEYAFIAARCAGLDKLYVSTDSEEIASIGARYNAVHIPRPERLATPDSLTEDVLTHAYDEIKGDIGSDTRIDTISLLVCNNPAIDVELLKQAVEFLRDDDEFDSCFTVARYDMFSPVRARKLGHDGEILPSVDLSTLDSVSSIRDSSGGTYFCDLSVQVMKPVCFENMENGQLPFKWMGRKSKALVTDYGFDIDSDWQFVVIEQWLRSRGYTEKTVPWKC